MREIKFRIWDRDSMSMGQDVLVINGKGLNCQFQDEDFLFMQYTGLKDVNGKEIYEGDIITGGSQEVEIVSFIDGGFEPFSRSDGQGGLPPSWCEVVGNIHENPELLESN
jgi:uncharacterized phage protein (TIGR01671 family)